MKGWSAKVQKVTILGRMNDVNVQVEMEVEYGEGINGIQVVKDITSYWRAAGLEPPVPGRNLPRTTGQLVGANGTHPDDLIPFFDKTGQRQKCPNCGKELYLKVGVTRNQNSPRFGQKWTKWFCEKSRGGCGAYNFDGKMEARFD